MNQANVKSLFKSKTVWTIILCVAIVLGYRALKVHGYAEPWMEEFRDIAVGVLGLVAIFFRKYATSLLTTPNDEPAGHHEHNIENSPWTLPAFFGLCAAPLLLSGCITTRAEVVNTRETLWQGSETIRQDHKDWMEGRRNPADLKPEDKNVRRLLHSELEEYVRESRERDNQTPSTQPAR